MAGRADPCTFEAADLHAVVAIANARTLELVRSRMQARIF